MAPLAMNRRYNVIRGRMVFVKGTHAMTKYCIDCKHLTFRSADDNVTDRMWISRTPHGVPICSAPIEDIILGPSVPRNHGADWERAPTGECGPDGILWEPKNQSSS